MDYTYNRRRGIDWQSDLYLDLLRFIHENNIMINEHTHSSISTVQLLNLSKVIFPKYGGRKAYQSKVRYFLQCYFVDIIEDLPSKYINIDFFSSSICVPSYSIYIILEMENEAEQINAPKLQEWINYKVKLRNAMCDPSIRQNINLFLQNTNYKLPLSTRIKILNRMYNLKIEEGEKIEPPLMKKLNNCLQFNRNEICNNVHSAISSISSTNNDGSSDGFHGFGESDRNISLLASQKSLVFPNQLNSESKGVSRVLLERNCMNNLDNSNNNADDNNEIVLTKGYNCTKIPGNKINKKRFTRKINLQNQICKSVLDFFRQKGKLSRSYL